MEGKKCRCYDVNFRIEGVQTILTESEEDARTIIENFIKRNIAEIGSLLMAPINSESFVVDVRPR